MIPLLIHSSAPTSCMASCLPLAWACSLACVIMRCSIFSLLASHSSIHHRHRVAAGSFRHSRVNSKIEPFLTHVKQFVKRSVTADPGAPGRSGTDDSNLFIFPLFCISSNGRCDDRWWTHDDDSNERLASTVPVLHSVDYQIASSLGFHFISLLQLLEVTLLLFAFASPYPLAYSPPSLLPLSG